VSVTSNLAAIISFPLSNYIPLSSSDGISEIHYQSANVFFYHIFHIRARHLIKILALPMLLVFLLFRSCSAPSPLPSAPPTTLFPPSLPLRLLTRSGPSWPINLSHLPVVVRRSAQQNRGKEDWHAKLRPNEPRAQRSAHHHVRQLCVHAHHAYSPCGAQRTNQTRVNLLYCR
jgi:hypothetical protein